MKARERQIGGFCETRLITVLLEPWKKNLCATCRARQYLWDKKPLEHETQTHRERERESKLSVLRHAITPVWGRGGGHLSFYFLHFLCLTEKLNRQEGEREKVGGGRRGRDWRGWFFSPLPFRTAMAACYIG